MGRAPRTSARDRRTRRPAGFARFFTKQLLLFVALSCIPCSGSTIYAGILRGAGDTKTVARTTLWIVAVLRPFAAWLLCCPLKLHQYGIWTAFALAHFLRWIFLDLHWRKGSWKQIKL